MDFQNVDGLCGSIVAANKATLRELMTVYTLEEAFILWEIIAVTKHNEYLAYEHAKNSRDK